MKTLTIREAREGLSHPDQMFADSDEVLVVNRGEPVARILPVEPAAQDSVRWRVSGNRSRMQDVPSEVLISRRSRGALLSAYIDTSALAKCYIREPRSLDVLDWADAEDEVCISPLTLVEFRCLLARRRRAAQIERHAGTRALARIRPRHARPNVACLIAESAELFDRSTALDRSAARSALARA